MQSLASKYRPSKFEDVCSQKSIIRILERQLEVNQLKNCYLFAGASGCGKTTMARIFAHEINKYIDKSGNVCSSDPIEIDGASNNGVDNVKQIIKAASERSLDGKYKIYIIDECHALTAQAWQAFLKCIEEPPEYTIFIFCTTDPQKIPATILNRVMRFNFTRITTEVIKQRLLYICEQEHFINYVDACDYIARISQGCMRDAISSLDKAASYNNDLNLDNVLNALGNFSFRIMFDLLWSLELHDEKNVLGIINLIYNQGNDLKLFIEQFLIFCLDIHKYFIFNTIAMTSIPNTMESEISTMFSALQNTDISNYYSTLVNKLLNCKNEIKNDPNIKSTIEVEFLNICKLI